MSIPYPEGDNESQQQPAPVTFETASWCQRLHEETRPTDLNDPAVASTLLP